MGAISAQWSLNETVGSMSDILRASTSDNIQLNALLVVQAFGTQLAVSGTTRLKIETMSKAPHLHYTVKFLKSKIGYAKGDSADYLSRTDGGIRFLSLACALLCTSSTFFAASTLHAMILDTAPSSYKDNPDGPGLPTVKMLQQLLDALDHKLCRVGFATYIAGFQVNLSAAYPLGNDDQHPSMELMKAVVDAFRSTHRLGSNGTVQIRAHIGIPWIVAFTKWTIDEPPSVVGSNGKVLLESPSRIIVCINKSSTMREEVKIMHKIKSPDVLWSGPLLESLAWSGMMSVESYGRLRLAALGLNSTEARKALRETLTATIPLVLQRLWPRRSELGTPFHPALGVGYHHRDACFDFPHFRSQFFGTHQQLKSILADYLNLTDLNLPMTVNENKLKCFPALEVYLSRVVSSCRCRTCSHKPSDYKKDNGLGLKHHRTGAKTDFLSLANSVCGDMVEYYRPNHTCAAMRFFAYIAVITTEVLALSLFDCTQPIQPYWPGASASLSRTKSPFTDSVHYCIFRNTKTQFCQTKEVISLATSLVGHRVDEEIETGIWIASSSRGQVIYPLVFDLGEANSHPLALGGGPGQLLFQDSKPGVVVSKTPKTQALNHTSTAIVPPVTCFHNKYPREALKWQISLTVGAPELFFGTPRCQIEYNPYDVITTLSRSLFVNCEHPEDTPLRIPAKDCVWTTAPLFESTKNPRDFDSIDAFGTHVHIRKVQNESGRKPFKIQVLPTAGNDGLRLFAMCSPWPGVVREKACLQCCIEVCRKSGLEYIVL